ncbi:HIRAN domain-containing protein [Paenibacillus sp. TAB 01]|uniref:HIRAN domain-containing protein n=1 Tax=Paenibacillus sp. TAB 01 TaxID=3368988 RepID=UPI0037530ABA
MSKVSFNKLLINWKSQETKKNYLVGVLEKKDSKYKFFYISNILIEAGKEGFTPFVGLSETEKIYESEKLFPVFERRLPNKNRSDFKKFLQDNNLDLSDDVYWDYFVITHGRLATDSLSFSNPVVIENERMFFSFDVAGWSIYKIANAQISRLTELTLHIEEDNEHDPFAVKILDSKKMNLIGYIPRPFNVLFYRLLKNNLLISAQIYHIDPENYRPSVIITALGKSVEFIREENDLQYLIDYHGE